MQDEELARPEVVATEEPKLHNITKSHWQSGGAAVSPGATPEEFDVQNENASSNSAKVQFPSRLPPGSVQDSLPTATSSSPSTEVVAVPRRRFQRGRVYRRGKRWVGSY